jgi:O-methyltransferase involved in polyketide biosynthesis
MKAHPGGTVVELGVGLETQFQRCDDGQVRWLCIDVPEAMAVRDRFIKPTQRCHHIAKSALDLSWMDEFDAARGLFVTAQGLFMYFHEQDVRRLLVAVIERFPGVEIMFDVIPPWFSRKTLGGRGFRMAKNYVAPASRAGGRRLASVRQTAAVRLQRCTAKSCPPRTSAARWGSADADSAEVADQRRVRRRSAIVEIIRPRALKAIVDGSGTGP